MLWQLSIAAATGALTWAWFSTQIQTTVVDIKALPPQSVVSSIQHSFIQFY